MNVEVNWLAVVLAAASTMAVGSVWYAKPVFGRSWMKLVKLDVDKATANAGKALGLTLLGSLVTAYVLAHLTYMSHVFFEVSFMNAALTTAFWVWAGFTAARIMTHDLFENRPAKLTLMNVGHELLTLIVMAVVIGAIGL